MTSYVYECTTCSDSLVIGKYRVITKEEYAKIYSESVSTQLIQLHTYYMNENNSVLVESKI
jgi:hypothetical protein